MRKIAIISIVLYVVLSILLCGCGGYVNYKNKKADDELSKQIYEKLGEDVYYISKRDSQGTKGYDFLLKKEDKEIVKEFMLVVDGVLSQNGEKTIVYLTCEIPGGLECLVLLENYSDDARDKADLAGAKRILVRYPEVSDCEVFKDPTIYTVLEDIQFLEIDEELQKIAEEQGIDWYEVWPTLEEMWIRDGEELYMVE